MNRKGFTLIGTVLLGLVLTGCGVIGQEEVNTTPVSYEASRFKELSAEEASRKAKEEERIASVKSYESFNQNKYRGIVEYVVDKFEEGHTGLKVSATEYGVYDEGETPVMKVAITIEATDEEYTDTDKFIGLAYEIFQGLQANDIEYARYSFKGYLPASSGDEESEGMVAMVDFDEGYKSFKGSANQDEFFNSIKSFTYSDMHEH